MLYSASIPCCFTLKNISNQATLAAEEQPKSNYIPEIKHTMGLMTFVLYELLGV